MTKFIVNRVDPKLEEVVFDPACGTGGFLTCAIDHKVENYVKTSKDREALARTLLLKELANIDGQLTALAKSDPVTRLLMTTPGVGVIVALTFRSAIDDPGRFPRSRDVGAWAGLTPRRWQSGKMDIAGRITKAGDPRVPVTQPSHDLHQIVHVDTIYKCRHIFPTCRCLRLVKPSCRSGTR